MNRPRYQRAPSRAVHAHLGPQGVLAPLLCPRTLGDVRLDVHLREKNEVHAYYAQARVIKARLAPGQVHLDAAPAYHDAQGSVPLFGSWSPPYAAFPTALDQYFAAVPSTVRTTAEGHVQAAWSGVLNPWIPIDREARIGYPDPSDAQGARRFDAVSAARAEVVAEGLVDRPTPWRRPPEYDRYVKLDQLAIDSSGRLVLIELKHGGSDSLESIFYAPLQLLQYAHEWCRAFATIRADVEALRDARIAVGLSPANTPRLNGEFRLAVGFGEALPSTEVQRRLRVVCSTANRHLPDGVGPIEVWAMPSGVPVQLL